MIYYRDSCAGGNPDLVFQKYLKIAVIPISDSRLSGNDALGITLFEFTYG